mgnify:CR=1 FL=1
MVTSQVVLKKPIIGSHYLPYKETYTRDASFYLWWAFCIKNMKTWLKTKLIELGKMLLVVCVISVWLFLTLYPSIVEPKPTELVSNLYFIAGSIFAILVCFSWLYIPYAHKNKNWSIKNFCRHQWNEIKESTVSILKEAKEFFKGLFWLAVILLGIGIVIGLFILFGSIVASMSATTIIIILLVLILLK